MSFLELAAERYSVRNFSSRPVEDEKLALILEAGRLAPTAVNYQPQKIYIVKSAEALSKLDALRPLFGAPLALVICYDPAISWKNKRDSDHDSGEVDAAIVTTHMMMEAWELGIGSCWMAAFSPADVASALGIADGLTPVAILPLGYPAENCEPSPRHLLSRDLSEMVLGTL